MAAAFTAVASTAAGIITDGPRKTPSLWQTKLVALLALLALAGCSTGAPMTPCPDPDPDPNSPCATSHSHTYDGRS
jgi:hypothetical protein